MSEVLRPATPEDVPACGRICFEAFGAINAAHGFAQDFPSAEVAAGLIEMIVRHPGFYGVVAERDGRVTGSNFLDERSVVFGIGPITVDPGEQNHGVGRRLMQDVLRRAASKQAPGVRLVQAAFHNRSLSLYTSLGFRVREPLSVMQGPALKVGFPGYDIRPMEVADLEACNALCRDVHGMDRGGELRDAVEMKTARLVEHLGKITGYATEIGFIGHAVARSNQDLMALIGAAGEFGGPGFLMPTRNWEVFSWCLANGLRVIEPLTLMTAGVYNEPVGAYLPSILY